MSNKTQLQEHNEDLQKAITGFENATVVPLEYGDATPADVRKGKTFTAGQLSIDGIPEMQTGTLEDVSGEVAKQTPLIQSAIEKIVGKETGANATETDIVKGKAAYVGQKLVHGTLEQMTTGLMPSSLPYNFTFGGAGFIDGELHIYGSDATTGLRKNHYAFKNGVWVEQTAIPFDFARGAVLTINNENHLVGGVSSREHRKFDGEAWTKVSELPINISNGDAVVLNGEIHILVGTQHMKYSGGQWVNASTLPYNFVGGSAAVLDGEIHIAGASSSSHYYKHCKWNGNSWTQLPEMKDSFNIGKLTVIDGKLHRFGGSQPSKRKHQIFNGTTWIPQPDLAMDFYEGTIANDGKLVHLLGGEQYTMHYVPNVKVYI